MTTPIITMTTDFGLRDFYTPSVKGYILSKIPHANIVDITHQIKPFHIAEAAFILKNSYCDFPPGTIHLVSVESDFSFSQDYLMVKYREQYFIARDNGLISLIIEDPGEELYKVRIEDRTALKFPMKHVMATTACALIDGREPREIGDAMDSMQMRTNLRAILMEEVIRGTIIYIDNFGNAITNIEPDQIRRYQEKGNPQLNYSRHEYIRHISDGYEDVPEGERLCLFGATWYLEIAINKGNASQLLGLNTGHTVLMEFT